MLPTTKAPVGLPARPARRPSRATRTLVVALLALLPLASSACDWTQFRAAADHPGTNTSESTIGVANAGTLVTHWTAPTGGIVTSSPATSNGITYVGSHDGKVYAQKASTGALVWSTLTGGPVESSPAVGSITDAAHVSHSVVFVGSDDGNLYALDALTGGVVWTTALGGQVASSPALVGGALYVGANGPVGTAVGRIYSLDPATGAVNWVTVVDGRITSSPAVNPTPTPSGATLLYIGSSNRFLYALNTATGAIVWQTPTGAAITSSPSVASVTIPGTPPTTKSLVFVGSTDHLVWAFDANTGAVVWASLTGAPVVSSPRSTTASSTSAPRTPRSTRSTRPRASGCGRPRPRGRSAPRPQSRTVSCTWAPTTPTSTPSTQPRAPRSRCSPPVGQWSPRPRWPTARSTSARTTRSCTRSASDRRTSGDGYVLLARISVPRSPPVSRLPGMETSDRPTIVSVNVGLPRTVEWRGREVTSAIWKEPVSGPVVVAGVNLDGDDQADRRVHGGPDKAVYAYASEDYEWWAGSRGPLAPGTFGENLTTAGIDLGASHVGDRWTVGSVVFEVAQPRQPCFKLGIRMGDDTFPDLFDEAKRPGAYLRIVRAGSLAAGDVITVEPARHPAVSLATLVADDPDEATLRQTAADERVPEGWRKAALRALRRNAD